MLSLLFRSFAGSGVSDFARVDLANYAAPAFVKLATVARAGLVVREELGAHGWRDRHFDVGMDAIGFTLALAFEEFIAAV